VGLNAWPGYEFLYLAQEEGYFRDEGLDVRVVEFCFLSDARRAYERGQIDILGTTVIEVLQIRDNRLREPQIVQVVDCSDGADVIIARPGFASGASLKGARVGVELASLGIYVLIRRLEKSGLSFADVETVFMDQLSMEEAFVELRKISPRIPVILPSGYSAETATENFLGFQLNGFLQKPYQMDSMRAIIQEALGPGKEYEPSG